MLLPTWNNDDFIKYIERLIKYNNADILFEAYYDVPFNKLQDGWFVADAIVNFDTKKISGLLYDKVISKRKFQRSINKLNQKEYVVYRIKLFFKNLNPFR